MQINIKYYDSPLGEIVLGSYGDKLCLADWEKREDRSKIDSRVQGTLHVKYREKSSDVIEKTITQLDEYFSLARKDFDIPLLLLGTEFQKSVWEVLNNIPYGMTVSYVEIARGVSKEKAVRVVATAIGANAISILVPCHRIIGSNGALRGYAGGIEAKRKLIEMEQNSTY